MSNPVDIKIARINNQDQNKGSLDKDKVFEVFQRNINEVLKGHFIDYSKTGLTVLI